MVVKETASEWLTSSRNRIVPKGRTSRMIAAMAISSGPASSKDALRRGVRERVDQAADEIGDQRLEDREHEAEREERDEEALRLGDEVPVEPPQRIRRRLLRRLFPEIDAGLEKAEHRLELIVVAPNQTGEGRNDATLFGRAVTNALQID